MNIIYKAVSPIYVQFWILYNNMSNSITVMIKLSESVIAASYLPLHCQMLWADHELSKMSDAYC